MEDKIMNVENVEDVVEVSEALVEEKHSGIGAAGVAIIVAGAIATIYGGYRLVKKIATTVKAKKEAKKNEEVVYYEDVINVEHDGDEE